MALVKRLEKGSKVSAAEYDAVVDQVETNQGSVEVIQGQFADSEVTLSFADLAAATSYWNLMDAASLTPSNNVEIYLQDVKQFYKWDSGETAKAVYSRDYLEKATEIASGNNNVAVSGDVADADKVITDKLKLTDGNISDIGTQTNLVKTVNLTDGFRTDNSGNIIPDGSYFISAPIEVTEGDRLATVSSNTGVFPRFAFYSSETTTAGNFISISVSSRDATVPVGATHLLVASLLSQKDSLILQVLASGFPTLAQNTFNYSNIYTKEEIDDKETVLNNEIKEKLNQDKIGVELNLFVNKDVGTIDNFRVDNSGNVIPDTSYFRLNTYEVTEGDYYGTVSSNTGFIPRFSFYSSATTTSGNFVSNIDSRGATVPSGATHMIVASLKSVKDSYILMKLDSGFPTLGQDTFQLTNIYNKSEIDDSLNEKQNIDDLGVELNLLKNKDNSIRSGYRVDNSGNVIPDSGQFLLDDYVVTEGQRFSTVSSNTGIIPRFSFYSSTTTTPSNLISIIDSREATVPSGATVMLFSSLNSLKDSYILLELENGFPELNQNTFNFTNLYDKKETIYQINDKTATFYPDVFELDIIDVQTDDKILIIDENDVLYGTNGFRDIIKATEYDLSDKVTVCTLNSLSTLQKLVFVSDNKAVGYVRSTVEADEGFYCFDNADTNTWTARRISKMSAGFPAFEFQSLIKCSTNNYLFACSYSSGVNGGKDLPSAPVNPAPVNIYRSTDLGETWSIVYSHPDTTNTHMHAIEFDTYRNRVWCAVGDEGSGGTPGWVYSDDYGSTWDFVENNDAEGQTPFMDTAILPTRKYVLFGSDYTPAGIRKWEPEQDIKNATVSNKDVDSNFYLVPVEVDLNQNFGFFRSPFADISSYPYKIGMICSYNQSYSKSAIFLSPNFKDWYMFDLVDDPLTDVNWNWFSGITSDGWVIGWSNFTGTNYHRRFKFPNWINN